MCCAHIFFLLEGKLKLSSVKQSIIRPIENHNIIDQARLAAVWYLHFIQIPGIFELEKVWCGLGSVFCRSGYWYVCWLLMLNHSTWCSASKSVQRGVPVLREGAQWSRLLQTTHQHCPQGNNPSPPTKIQLYLKINFSTHGAWYVPTSCSL